MYCSACGSQLQQGLVYCSKCGKRIAEDTPTHQSVSPDVLKAVGYLGSAGFFAFIFVVYVFLRSGAPSNQLIPLSFFFFAALFGLSFLLLHYGKGFVAKQPHSALGPSSDTQTSAYFEPAPAHRLSEPANAGFQSVTEHTTRTLDEVPIERK